MNPITGGTPARPPHKNRRRALWVVLGLLGAGCIYDEDDPCSPNQVRWENSSLCVCAEGTAYTAEGCVPCGEHALASPSGCVCEAGYARTLPTDPCLEIPADIGMACTSDAECPSLAFPHCQLGTLGGYCTTTGCTSDADCTGGYACNLGGAPPFCQRPPVGAGRPCTSDAECAGTEATFCDVFVSFSCLVSACTIEPNNCFAGMECCAFGPTTICIPEGLCTTS
jgi:hypothetical protein